MVSTEICNYHPGALTFMMAAYHEYLPEADLAFQRMLDNGIVGDQLYILWYECCNKNTYATLQVMINNDIDDIKRHINYNRMNCIKYDIKEETNHVQEEESDQN